MNIIVCVKQVPNTKHMTIDPESFIDVACMQHRVQLPDGTVLHTP